jgi:transglutaminase-like putative cysteine protease
MDFHAWFEAYLGDRWWAFDARFNVPRIGRIPIGIGRDAVDVAMLTTYGAARFERMTVWTELAEPDDADDDEAEETIEAGTTDEPDESEALVLEHGRA